MGYALKAGTRLVMVVRRYVEAELTTEAEATAANDPQAKGRPSHVGKCNNPE